MGSLCSLVKTHPCVLKHSPIENASTSQSRKLAQNAMGTTSSMLCSERLRILSTCCRKRCVGFIMKVWSGEPNYTKWYDTINVHLPKTCSSRLKHLRTLCQQVKDMSFASILWSIMSFVNHYWLADSEEAAVAVKRPERIFVGYSSFF